MALTNLKVVNDEQTTQTRAHAAIEAYNARSDEPVDSRLVVVSRGRRLDVDDVLARSLPSLTVKGVNAGKEKSPARL